MAQAGVTADSIKSRFGGKRWIEVVLRDYEGPPTSQFGHVETLRHTVKGAEILLLLRHNLDLVSQVAWDLLHEAPTLVNRDGGWKEFQRGEQPLSLYASSYVFRFLSQFRQLRRRADLLGEPQRFVAESLPLLERTEGVSCFAVAQAKVAVWKPALEGSAPDLFIEYPPFSTRHDVVEEIYEPLRELVALSGRLIDPAVGRGFGAPEYALSIRVAYALACTDSLRPPDDSKRAALERWLLDS